MFRRSLGFAQIPFALVTISIICLAVSGCGGASIPGLATPAPAMEPPTPNTMNLESARVFAVTEAMFENPEQEAGLIFEDARIMQSEGSTDPAADQSGSANEVDIRIAIVGSGETGTSVVYSPLISGTIPDTLIQVQPKEDQDAQYVLRNPALILSCTEEIWVGGSVNITDTLGFVFDECGLDPANPSPDCKSNPEMCSDVLDDLCAWGCYCDTTSKKPCCWSSKNPCATVCGFTAGVCK